MHLESGDETVIFEGILSETVPRASLQAAITQVYVDKYDLDPSLDEGDAVQYRLEPRKVHGVAGKWFSPDCDLLVIRRLRLELNQSALSVYPPCWIVTV